MQPWLEGAEICARGGAASLKIIQSWGFDENLAGLKMAVQLIKKAKHA